MKIWRASEFPLGNWIGDGNSYRRISIEGPIEPFLLIIDEPCCHVIADKIIRYTLDGKPINFCSGRKIIIITK